MERVYIAKFVTGLAPGKSFGSYRDYYRYYCFEKISNADVPERHDIGREWAMSYNRAHGMILRKRVFGLMWIRRENEKIPAMTYLNWKTRFFGAERTEPTPKNYLKFSLTCILR